MSIYRLPIGELLLDELYIGQDDLTRRISVRVETCNGMPAFHERMLSFKDGSEQVVKECSYRLKPRITQNTTYIRVIITCGMNIIHTARGDWKHGDLGQAFRAEDLEPFTSARDALAYAQSWVRSNMMLREPAEVMA